MAVICLNIGNYSSIAIIVFENSEKSSRLDIMVRRFACKADVCNVVKGNHHLNVVKFHLI